MKASPGLQLIYETAAFGLAFLRPIALSDDQSTFDRNLRHLISDHLGQSVREMVPQVAPTSRTDRAAYPPPGEPITGVEVNGQRTGRL